MVRRLRKNSRPVAHTPLQSTISVSHTAWRGLAAWRVASEYLALTVMKSGGHIAALTTATGALNPFWQPGWPADDPVGMPYDGAVLKRPGWERTLPYGGNFEAPLLAGIVGFVNIISLFNTTLLSACTIATIYASIALAPRTPARTSRSTERWVCMMCTIPSLFGSRRS